MSENKTPATSEASLEPEIKRYTPEELAEKRRKERQDAARKAKKFKEKYLEFYDDIKQPENPSW
ncbi:MAG: hypothetical protein GX095_04660 [Clostridiales bacterium]|jgi:hypothetical protein|nr:hypothetical protein [Clostridiales bacterium]HOB63888.1 hypothetical protein [Clostridia bacterium]HOK82550.1 hypothetical protein [Clostridia bacterium]HOL61666.1 hypothetical protein [Clostridia bacterium]HPO54311.1 hypothetical protein [Clostridia bacterium]